MSKEKQSKTVLAVFIDDIEKFKVTFKDVEEVTVVSHHPIESISAWACIIEIQSSHNAIFVCPERTLTAYFFRTTNNKMGRMIVGVNPDSIGCIVSYGIDDKPSQPFEVIRLGYDIDTYCLPLMISDPKRLSEVDIPFGTTDDGVVYVMREHYDAALVVAETSKKPNRLN